ncbi:hypothetical protein [Methylobacterium nigriterrae]|uniref:hypothetical protein n=1 Tax=Methylobacterium nigriterrae TaxID=3127512 RepID=UPI0030137E61
MNQNDRDELDPLSRLHAKMVALEIVLGVVIGRLSEDDPQVREDVRRDVDILLADLPIDGPSEAMISAEVRHAAERLLSVRVG